MFCNKKKIIIIQFEIESPFLASEMAVGGKKTFLKVSYTLLHDLHQQMQFYHFHHFSQPGQKIQPPAAYICICLLF